MTDKPLARPPQVTLSGWLILGGSVLMVLMAFQEISQIGSIETQEAVADLVTEPPVEGLGLSANDVQMILRVLCLVAGGAAAASTILGWQVLQRSHGARWALTALAPVLLVAGLAPTQFAAALVAAAIAMLWTQPARDWFAGRAPAPSPAAAAVASASTRPSAPVPPRPVTQTETPQAPPNPYRPAAPPVADPSARPGAVLAAGLLSIGGSVLALAALVPMLVLALRSRADYVDFIDEALADTQVPEGVTVADLADILLVLLGLMIAWCLVAIGIALLAMRGIGWARITLVVSASGAALMSLIGILTIVALVLTAAAVATVVLLMRGDVNRWYATQRQR